jgi:hypothetical protein
VTEPGDATAHPAAAVDAMRRLWLDLARLTAGPGDDRHAVLFHDWLHDLPLPAGGAAPPPVHELGLSFTLGGDRTTWFAAGTASAMIQPAAHLFAAIDADEAELERLGELGPALEPHLLGTWLEVRGEHLNGGWSMAGGLDNPLALTVIDDGDQRELIAAAVAEHAATDLVSIGRSVGAGTVTARIRLALGPASDDEALVAATSLLARLDAPQIPDAVLRAVLGGAGECALGLSLWTLGDGLARVGLVVEQPPLHLFVRLAHEGDWPEGLARSAAALGTLHLEHPTRLEWLLDADGPDVELTALVPPNLPPSA